MTVVDLPHLRREPRLDVDAVGDVADRHAVFRGPGNRPAHIARETWPCSDETALARRTSLSASTVMQNALAAIARVDAAEPHERVVIEAERLAERTEVLFDRDAREKRS